MPYAFHAVNLFAKSVADNHAWHGQYRRCLILSRRLQAVRVCNVREGKRQQGGIRPGSLVVWRDLIERNPIFMFEERHAQPDFLVIFARHRYQQA